MTLNKDIMISRIVYFFKRKKFSRSIGNSYESVSIHARALTRDYRVADG